MGIASLIYVIGGAFWCLVWIFLAIGYFSRRLKRPLLSFVTASILFLVFLIIAIAFYFSAQDQYCTTCHVMKPYAEASEKSSHAKISCYGCHGYKGVVRWVGDNVKEISLNLSGKYEKPINAHSGLSKEIPSEVCELCHVMPRKVMPSPGIIIVHGRHAEKGIKCTFCHNRIAHGGVGGYEGEGEAKVKQVVFEGQVIKTGIYPDRMKMRYCMKCHTGGKGELEGPRDCSVCHPKDFELKPKNHLVASFLKPLDIKVRAAHTKGAKLDKEYCFSCHQDKFCFDCHGMDMPHPKKDWTAGKKEHLALGKANPQSCVQCHPQANFCSACHHPDWKPEAGPWWSTVAGQSQHKAAVLAKGATPCFKCHDPRFCAHCHISGELLR